MAVLALAYVTTGFLPDSPTIDLIDLALTAIFGAEFGSRFLAAHDVEYLRGHWIDLVALVPAIRGARILRFFGCFAWSEPSPAPIEP